MGVVLDGVLEKSCENSAGRMAGETVGGRALADRVSREGATVELLGSGGEAAEAENAAGKRQEGEVVGERPRDNTVQGLTFNARR